MIMKNCILFVLLMFVPVLAMAQTSGGQISRKSNVTTPSSKQSARKSPRPSTATNVKVINV